VKLGWLEFRKRKTTVFSVAFVFFVYLGWTVVSSYCYGSEPGTRLAELIDFVTKPVSVSTDATCTSVALLLYTLHISRRLYECLRVSIFSRSQVVNPLQLVRDNVYYIAAGLTLIADSPRLVQQESCCSISSLRWFHIVAVGLFYFASKVHHNTHQHFAKLRRNRSGHIVTTDYKQPKDGWFESLNVSCPHYFAEILIYASVGLALGSPTWWCLTTYVTANQFYMAYNTQRFYQVKFKDYPAHRKIILPFLF
jgi:3-oxo-5-alpha-steroid 4-dehydrogenase 3